METEYEIPLISEDSLIARALQLPFIMPINPLSTIAITEFSRSYKKIPVEDDIGHKDRGLKDISILVGVQKILFDQLIY